MTVIDKIYIKGIVQLHRKNNSWADEDITNLLINMTKNPEIFKMCARSVRGKYSYSKALIRFENGHKY